MVISFGGLPQTPDYSLTPVGITGVKLYYDRKFENGANTQNIRVLSIPKYSFNIKINNVKSCGSLIKLKEISYIFWRITFNFSSLSEVFDISCN